jgi:putative DNA primase/helicase
LRAASFIEGKGAVKHTGGDGGTRYPEESFYDAMLAELGHAPARIVADGKIHRFPTSKDKRDDVGWYLFHNDDSPAGEFGDWRTGEQHTWHANGVRKLSPADGTRIKELEAARERDRAEGHARAAQKARTLWDEAQPASPHHPYLVQKGIEPHGARKNSKGQLLVPVISADGTLFSLETIDDAGEKRFLHDGRVSGGSSGLASPANPSL